MGIILRFLFGVKRVATERICPGCRQPFEGVGCRYARRAWCSATCVPAVLREIQNDIAARARRAGVAIAAAVFLVATCAVGQERRLGGSVSHAPAVHALAPASHPHPAPMPPARRQHLERERVFIYPIVERENREVAAPIAVIYDGPETPNYFGMTGGEEQSPLAKFAATHKIKLPPVAR